MKRTNSCVRPGQACVIKELTEKEKTRGVIFRGFEALLVNCFFSFRCTDSQVPVAASVRHDKYPIAEKWLIPLPT